MSTKGVGTFGINSVFASGNLVFYEKAVGRTATGDVLTVGTEAVKVGGTSQDVDLQWYGTGSISAILDAGDSSLTLVGVNLATNAPVVITDATESTSTITGALIVSGGIGFAKDMYVGDDIFLTSGAVINFNAGDVTITHSANALAFAGATAAGINGYSFDTAAGTIATEAHGVDITTTGTLASSKNLVGANIKVTAAGTAGAWLAGLFVNATQASKMVNGYLCAAEFELTSTAAGASDNSVVVLNSVRNHTGSPPACDPYITLREYGTTYGDTFFRIFGDTGQGAITGGASSTLLATGSADKAATCMVRCMFGSTVFWLLGTTNAPS